MTLKMIDYSCNKRKQTLTNLKSLKNLFHNNVAVDTNGAERLFLEFLVRDALFVECSRLEFDFRFVHL